MWEILKKLYTRRTDKVVGIDIGSTAVKFAEICYNPEPLLTNYGSVDYYEKILFEDKDIPVLAELIRAEFNRSGIKAEHAVLSANTSSTFVRLVDFPIMTDIELREAVRWEIEKYVPYEQGTYYYDYTVIGHNDNDLQLKVLLVAAQKKPVDMLVEISRQAGLKVLAIEIEPVAISRTIYDMDNSLIINIGAELVQITIFQASYPVVNRHIPLGGNRFTEVVAKVLELDNHEAEMYKRSVGGLMKKADITDNTSELDNQFRALIIDISKEIRRTADYYMLQNKDAVIRNILVTGGGSYLENIAQHLSVLLENEVIYHDPLKGIIIAGSLNNAYIKKQSRQIAVALGLALRGGEFD